MQRQSLLQPSLPLIALLVLLPAASAWSLPRTAFSGSQSLSFQRCGLPDFCTQHKQRPTGGLQALRGGMSEASLEPVLITWDIDGTICVQDETQMDATPNAMHTRAFSFAFKQVFGIDASINEVKHQGSTDPLILVKVLMARGYAKEEIVERLDAMKEAMVKYVADNGKEAADGLKLLPGSEHGKVKEVLAKLSATPNVVLGLVTGNLQPIAWAKMEALGIAEYFTVPRVGGFGSDYCAFDPDRASEDRAELIRIAARRAQECVASKKAFARRYHIGDAPNDVMAAKAGGAIALGVCTGVFDREQLREAAPDATILRDLSNLQEALSAFGVDSA